MKLGDKGFTVMEVLIATAILAFLGLATGTVGYNTFRIKENAQKDMQTLDIGRGIVRMISSDILLAFNRAKRGKKNPNPQNNLIENPDLETMPTLFIGKDVDPYDELHLTTFSHKRFYKNSHEAEHAEVSYFVEADSADPENMILFRRASKRIDEKPLEGGKVDKLAEYVTFFTLRYWDCEKEKYVEEWNSVESIDYREKFPEAVEIRVGLDDFKGGERIFETVSQIKMPNNLRRREDVKIVSGQDASKLTISQQTNCNTCKQNKVPCPSYCPAEKGGISDESNKKIEPLLVETPVGSCTQ